MQILGQVFFLMGMFILGFIIQYLIRWTPNFNLFLSYLLVLILPAEWSIGIVMGSWIATAFVTFSPNRERRLESYSALSGFSIFLYSLWTLGGFVLTLIFLYKLKASHLITIPLHRELISWIFLILIEVCQFKIIALSIPVTQRNSLGYYLAVLNFLMILFCTWSMGVVQNILIFAILLLVFPDLLKIVDGSSWRQNEMVIGRR